jgi:SAM-dependent methyltransferase
MRRLDRVLQSWRISKVLPYLSAGQRVLDIGCADGTLFKQVGFQLAPSVGIDPDLAEPTRDGGGNLVHLIRGRFPDDLPPGEPFDVIAMLAVFEHVPEEVKPRLAEQCVRHLKDGGHLVLTVPSALVDPILDVLKAVRLIDGMDLEGHHHFEVSETPRFFVAAGLELVELKRFQLGLNNLFVFRKPARARETDARTAALD